METNISENTNTHTSIGDNLSAAVVQQKKRPELGRNDFWRRNKYFFPKDQVSQQV